MIQALAIYIVTCLMAWPYMSFKAAWSSAQNSSSKPKDGWYRVVDGVRIPTVGTYIANTVGCLFICWLWPVMLLLTRLHTREVSTRLKLAQAQERIELYEKGQL